MLILHIGVHRNVQHRESGSNICRPGRCFDLYPVLYDDSWLEALIVHGFKSIAAHLVSPLTKSYVSKPPDSGRQYHLPKMPRAGSGHPGSLGSIPHTINLVNSVAWGLLLARRPNPWAKIGTSERLEKWKQRGGDNWAKHLGKTPGQNTWVKHPSRITYRISFHLTPSFYHLWSFHLVPSYFTVSAALLSCLILLSPQPTCRSWNGLTQVPLTFGTWFPFFGWIKWWFIMIFT